MELRGGARPDRGTVRRAALTQRCWWLGAGGLWNEGEGDTLRVYVEDSQQDLLMALTCGRRVKVTTFLGAAPGKVELYLLIRVVRGASVVVKWPADVPTFLIVPFCLLH